MNRMMMPGKLSTAASFEPRENCLDKKKLLEFLNAGLETIKRLDRTNEAEGLEKLENETKFIVQEIKNGRFDIAPSNLWYPQD